MPPFHVCRGEPRDSVADREDDNLDNLIAYRRNRSECGANTVTTASLTRHDPYQANGRFPEHPPRLQKRVLDHQGGRDVATDRQRIVPGDNCWCPAD